MTTTFMPDGKVAQDVYVVNSNGGGGSQDVNVTNTSVAVTGPITNAQFTAVEGTAATAAWAGTGNGTVIAILKAIHAQNETMIGHLSQIATNTTPEAP